MLYVVCKPVVAQVLVLLTGAVSTVWAAPRAPHSSSAWATHELDPPPAAFGSCTSRPTLNDWLYIDSVDSEDEGTCVETHLHQAGVLRADSGDEQPYHISFPDGDCWFREDEVLCEDVGPSPNPPPPPPPPPPPARPVCDSDVDCDISSYCDSSNHCYTCGYIQPDRCDDESGDCCSANFLVQCPDDPANCNPPPPLGPACDLDACECDGVSLAALKGKTYHLPNDVEGYAYLLSMCGVIAKADLPSGCQEYAEYPSVVKFKADNPADCIEIGSTGPCSQGDCGMHGKRVGTSGSHLTVNFVYTYGCKNIFSIDLSQGSDAQPGQVTSDECTYTTSWMAPIGDAHRCVHDKCVKVADGLPGVSHETCEAACGPVSRCLSTLNRVCGESKRSSTSDCEYCTGSHDVELGLAGCHRSDYDSYCGAR